MKMNLKRKLKAVKNLLFVKIAHAYSEVTSIYLQSIITVITNIEFRLVLRIFFSKKIQDGIYLAISEAQEKIEFLFLPPRYRLQK